ncbi:hypothetical protein AAG906_003702 [Vitis piasezkii]
MPLYASLESSSGSPMVFCYCCLGTTLMAFRYYLSGLQTMPLYASLESSSGPPMVFCYCSLGTTLVAFRYYLSGLSIPSCSSLHSSSDPPIVFFLGLVGYPSDDINKFCGWFLLVACNMDSKYVSFGFLLWCIVGTLVSSFVPFEIPNICLDWQ